MADVNNTDVTEDEGITPPAPKLNPDGTTRRDFISLTAGAAGVVGAGAFIWPFVDQMNPAADTLALASIEVDLGAKALEPGQAITVEWRGKPVFIRRRTAEEIEAEKAVSLDELPDPQTDAERVKVEEYIIVLGVCTHLGCVPQGQQVGSGRGEFNGWFCPCHGSHYDVSGRIRKGPAPRNLDVPDYTFVTDTLLKLG